MKKLIFLLALVVVLSGCKKENPVTYSSSLIGEWSWVSTCGGFAGTCYYPQQTKESISLVYTVDSIYNYYLNDTLRTSCRFHVNRLIYSNPNDTVNVIKYDTGNSEEFFLIYHDTLSLTVDGADISSYYKRVK
jgi:hypothetical protein